MAHPTRVRRSDAHTVFALHGTLPPVAVPAGYVGPVFLSSTGRMVWWTGRVAIGLRHQPTRFDGAFTRTSAWMQALLIDDALDKHALVPRCAA